MPGIATCLRIEYHQINRQGCDPGRDPVSVDQVTPLSVDLMMLEFLNTWRCRASPHCSGYKQRVTNM